MSTVSHFMDESFLSLLQRRLGSTAIGASTARGMGPKGTIQAARSFLGSLDLRRFEVESCGAFARRLDEATEELRRSMPIEARHWGSSRKFLNIFMRNCCYNRHIWQHFDLATIEQWLEVPLDSHVAAGLRKHDPHQALPRWKTVVGLTPELSERFQSFAADVAEQQGVCRVHLDLLFWRAADVQAHALPDPQRQPDGNRVDDRR